MRWAVFSDVHGNIHALRRVLEVVERKNVDRVFCLGDLVGYGAHPNAVIELIQEKNISTVMGNYDEGVGFNLDDCGCAYTNEEEKQLGDKSLQWTKEVVSTENKKYLKGLNENLREKLGNMEVLLVHGSPRRKNEYLFSDRPEERVFPMLKKTEADVVICGHTHLPYYKYRDGIHLINVGSVGKPKTGEPNAHFVLLEYRETIAVSFEQVEYDYKQAAEDISSVGLPEKFAQNVLTGRG